MTSGLIFLAVSCVGTVIQSAALLRVLRNAQRSVTERIVHRGLDAAMR